MWPSMCRVPIHPFKENRPFRNFFVPRHSGPCSGSGLLFILFLKEEHSMMLTEQVFFSSLVVVILLAHSDNCDSRLWLWMRVEILD